ncbi:alpha-D-ribose 1-methylphosphonate 5-triphosphate synthase subunit PhnH [Robbsia andropogonis]|nr:phosphonate C-P lyase system protein PhnH [Robbsia andropogonis]
MPNETRTHAAACTQTDATSLIDTGADRHRAEASRPSDATSAWMLSGFADPVQGSQAAFRTALHALAHPGRLHAMPDAARCEAPAPLSMAMAALLLTLADGDTPIWLASEFDESIRRFLRFHNGCTLTDRPEKAAFAVLSARSGDPWPALRTFAQGDAANPHTSTTLLIELPMLDDTASSPSTNTSYDARSAERVILHGPGIATTQTLHAIGLPADFWTQWRANQTHFPLGVDVFLVCGATFCGLPRTTQREA